VSYKSKQSKKGRKISFSESEFSDMKKNVKTEPEELSKEQKEEEQLYK